MTPIERWYNGYDWAWIIMITICLIPVIAGILVNKGYLIWIT